MPDTLTSPELTVWFDLFSVESRDDFELDAAGWAFVPNEMAGHGRVLLDGGDLGPVYYGWRRPDVLAAYPETCPSEDTGFRSHLMLPRGIAPGEHAFEFVFFNERGREIARAKRAFMIEKGMPETRRGMEHPLVEKQRPRSLYLDLLEKTILGLPYAGSQEATAARDGREWPRLAHSMIGMERLRHLRICAETALQENVPGDFLEAGVWRGGASIMLRGVLRNHGDTSRNVWVADSFEGLPKPNPEKYPADSGDTLHAYPELAVSLEQVQDHFRRYDLLDEQVKFLKGWFSNTLPDAPVDRLALLRLDGDMYESTMDGLTHLYPRLSAGGFCIIDDYGCLTPCRQAVHDYRAMHGIRDPIRMIDWTGAWWRKS